MSISLGGVLRQPLIEWQVSSLAGLPS